MKKEMKSCDYLGTYGFKIQLFGDDNWTPPTREQWEATTRDLHFHKSELGDYKKKYTDLQTDYDKIKDGQGEEYNTLKASHEELTGKYADLSKAQQATILKYEGQALGLTEEDMKEIVLEEGDDAAKIIEKAKAKKEAIDKRVEAYLADKGLQTTVLKGKKGEKTSWAEKHRTKADGKEKKEYFTNLPK